LPVLRSDKAPFFKALKYVNPAIAQHIAVAREAGYFANFAVIISLIVNCATLSEHVQNTLLKL